MKKFWKKKERAIKPDSPEDGELLAYLDGELTPERQVEIRQSLEGDWKLRVRLAELERDIETYVKATRQQPQGELPSFEDVWGGVARRLTEPLEPLPVEAELQLRERDEINWPARFRRWSETLAFQPVLLRWSVAVIAGLVVTAGLSLWLLSSDHLHVVSAEELLQRATQSEAAQINQVAEPVVYRRIQVKRRGANESVMWESWKQAGRDQFRQRVADGQGWRFIRTNEQARPALIAEIEAIFQANRLDMQRPLSAFAFAEWRKIIRRKSEITQEMALPGSSANDGLKLTMIAQEPYAVNAIIEASLIVRKADWHTVAQRLKVQAGNEVREYELSETAHEVLPLQALTVFADLAPTPSPAATILPSPSRVPAVASPAPLPTALPTETALRDAEVAALFALHQMRADLGEQIEIVRDATGQMAGQMAGQIMVRGLVETEERKRLLAEALRNIPLVTARIQTVEEAARQAAIKPSAGATQAAPVNESLNTGASGRPATNAFERRLARYFSEQESGASADDRGTIDLKIARLSNELISESSAALSEAWALRRLLDRYPAEGELSPAAKQRIEEMTGNHIARLKSQSRKLRTRLEPILRAIAGEKTAPSSVRPDAESTKQAQAPSLFRAVEQAQQLTHRLFGGAGSASTPEEAARQLLESLARLDYALRNFEQVMTK